MECFGNSLRNSLGILCGMFWEFFVEFFGIFLWNSFGIFKELICWPSILVLAQCTRKEEGRKKEGGREGERNLDP